MLLYTSYFAKSASHPRAKSIARFSPKWYTGPSYLPVAPAWDLVKGIKNGTITREQYTEAYRYHLDSLGEQKVLAGLQDGDVLLCYERPGDFCHRHILAEWLNEKGHTVIEMEV